MTAHDVNINLVSIRERLYLLPLSLIQFYAPKSLAPYRHSLWRRCRQTKGQLIPPDVVANSAFDE